MRIAAPPSPSRLRRLPGAEEHVWPAELGAGLPSLTAYVAVPLGTWKAFPMAEPSKVGQGCVGEEAPQHWE